MELKKLLRIKLVMNSVKFEYLLLIDQYILRN